MKKVLCVHVLSRMPAGEIRGYAELHFLVCNWIVIFCYGVH